MRNKNKSVLVWMSEEERNKLKRKAKRYGMTVSDLVRHVLIYSDNLSITTIDIAPLRKMVFEIHKHGVNLNQMMKFLNTYGLDAFSENKVMPILENERTVFLEAKAALRSLEEEARERKVIITLEMPDDEEDEYEDS